MQQNPVHVGHQFRLEPDNGFFFVCHQKSYTAMDIPSAGNSRKRILLIFPQQLSMGRVTAARLPWRLGRAADEISIMGQ
jgi:hypothetical protein